MARNRSAVLVDSDAEFREIVTWYEDLLDRTYPPAGLLWPPVTVGPTWQWDGGWLLPERSLGWRVLAWCGVWLRNKEGQPWQFTAEQARFVLWFFAVDEFGGFAYHSAVLQRLKGWGKDPIAACLAVAGLFADVTFDHWDGDRPVGRDEPSAWVQIVAVSQEQTKNTMKLFPSLISAEARRRYGIQIGKLNVWGLGDTRQIQSVTSSPLAVEGGRPTLIIRNETQNWLSSNSGHEISGVIEGNAAKSERGVARILDICNAYRPDEDSIGERVREAWESTQGVDASRREFGLLYDSLEAHPDAPLTVEAAPSVVESIRGDADWLSVDRIIASIMNPSNPASESRRKWYNQITATEDAWVDPQRVKSCEIDTDRLVDGDVVTMFGDGSKSGDGTGLVLTRLSDGLTQVHHFQQPKAGVNVDRDAVDYAVVEAFNRYSVLAFWFDPSHAKDDDAEGDSRWWWPLVDEWSTRYGPRLRLHPTVSGLKKHAVAFDMLTPGAQALIVPAYEQLASDIESGLFRFVESYALRSHLVNARRRPGRYGVGIGKNARESRKKIDLAVCAAGSRMLWRMVRMSRGGGSPGRGRVIGL